MAGGLAFPEGPAFGADGRLWFVEIKGGCVSCWDGGDVVRYESGGAPNGVAFDWRGRIWFCDSARNEIRTFDPVTEAFETICESVDGKALDKPNDLAFDAKGNLVFTCPGDSRTEPTGYVCCLGLDGTTTKIREGLYFPNGLAFTADGIELVVAETYRQRLWRGAWDAGGRAWIEPKPWAENMGGAPGPDGMAFTSTGELAVAVYGAGHVQLRATGDDLEGVFELPGKNPTNVAFDPSGKLGIVVTEAERGLLLSLPDVKLSGARLFDGGGSAFTETYSQIP